MSLPAAKFGRFTSNGVSVHMEVSSDGQKDKRIFVYVERRTSRCRYIWVFYWGTDSYAGQAVHDVIDACLDISCLLVTSEQSAAEADATTATACYCWPACLLSVAWKLTSQLSPSSARCFHLQSTAMRWPCLCLTCVYLRITYLGYAIQWYEWHFAILRKQSDTERIYALEGQSDERMSAIGHLASLLSTPLTVIVTDKHRSGAHGFLLTFHSNFVPVFYSVSQIQWFVLTPWGSPWNFVTPDGLKKTRMIGLPGREEVWWYLWPFRHNTRVGRTDRQTDRQTPANS